MNLIDRGWQPTFTPGTNLVVILGSRKLAPLNIVRKLTASKMSEGEFLDAIR